MKQITQLIKTLDGMTWCSTLNLILNESASLLLLVVHHNSKLLIFNVIDAFDNKMLCPILKSVPKWNLVYCCTSQFTIADFKCDWCIWWQNVHSRQCHLNIMRMQNPHFYLTWAACSRYFFNLLQGIYYLE